MTNSDIAILVYLIVCIIIFLILREFFCWYWKINKMIKNQQSIIEQQKEILNVLKDSLKQQQATNLKLFDITEIIGRKANQDLKSTNGND